MPNYNISNSYVGLTPVVLPAAPNTGQYTIQGHIRHPSISQGSAANSTVVITVLQNATVIYTGSPGDNGFKVVMNLVQGDIVTVSPSSSSLVDQGKQSIRFGIQMWEGST